MKASEQIAFPAETREPGWAAVAVDLLQDACAWCMRTRLAAALARRELVHYLHIGKNAGTQVARVSERINQAQKRYRIVTHPHRVRLRDLPKGASYFFSIRSPENRFRSAFYSRKRKGLPRRYSEWSAHERRAFEDFEHANDLAEALFADGEAGLHALSAMEAISHCSMDQVDWFARCGYFLEVRPPLCILRQEAFEADLKVLLAKLGVEGRVSIERDPVSAHRNDYSDAPPLSEKAVRNLRAWYRQDVELYRRCEEWIRTHQRG